MPERRPDRLLVITGLSGAGKTSAMHALEDIGYFCVDNLPDVLVPGLLDCLDRSAAGSMKTAVVMDVRQGQFPQTFQEVILQVRRCGVEPEVLFLEATTESLERRFAQTGRPHPLAKDRTLREGIEAEREDLWRVKRSADRVIDTSSLNVHQIRQYLQQVYGEDGAGGKKLGIELISFGYARGIPPEADVIVDVRFLPNPHYDPRLRDLDGRVSDVQKAVQAEPAPREILEGCFEWLERLVAFLEETDRAYLKMGFGCTGGKHRSVAVVSLMDARLRSAGYAPRIVHRDIPDRG